MAIALAAWSHRNETDDEIDERHRRERYGSWRTDPDGMVTLTARLGPADAANVCAVIDKDVTTHSNSIAAAVDTSTDAPTGARNYPSLGQQRADALVHVTTEPDSGSGGVLTEVVVHVTPEGNALADGTPLADHAVGRMLPEALVSLLMEDNRRHPIDASPRRRFPTRRQRRVVDARGPECAQDGCHARDVLQYDHREPYDPTRPNTVIANLQRLCGPHNRAKSNRSQD